MRLITLGDNLTSQPGWADYLAETINANLINLATDNATNESQILAMHDYIFESDFKYSDIYIWQLATSSNTNKQIGPTLEEALAEPCKYYSYITNLKKNKTFNFNISEEEQLHEIHTLLTTIRKWSDRILVFRGWKEVVSPIQAKEFGNLLREHKINFVSETNIEWCSNQNLFFNTNGTPSEDSQIKFCDEVLIPKLKELGWI